MPTNLHAWGPGFHLEIALSVLEKCALIAPAIGPLIKAFPKHFIYGAVSPDITVGKKYAGYMHHCHNWHVGKLILDESKTEKERAAAYGYLVHLAADAIAHNYYIPYKIIKSYSARLLNHTYWEMRFDLSVSDEVWGHVTDIIRGNYKEFDRLMNRVLKKTLFSFGTNKRIFSSIVILHKMSVMRKTLKMYAKKSKWTLEGEDIKNYRSLTYKAVDEFLTKLGKARCLAANPAGLERLDYARDLRRKLKRFVNEGVVAERDADYFVSRVRHVLKEKVFDPKAVLLDIDDIM